MTTPTDTGDRAAARRRRLQTYATWIEQTCKNDPGARSALRSGWRRGMDDVRRMHRFIAPWLSQGSQTAEAEQRAFYAVAAMIAAQPRSRYTDTTAEAPVASSVLDAEEQTGEMEQKQRPDRYGPSLGASFAAAVTESPGREREMRESAAEARLNLLTRQSINGLHRHLPGSVRYLRELDVPVDWAQLLDDLIAWPAHSKRISRRWLQDYYRLRTRALREQADEADQQETDKPDAEA
ncbi:type I-E CRISPR-associated protein Cse2/CasB [Streptomyces violens]|uniref:type I-E CRISPR-associated protein Cse2/CasB n=1 Tax=Streptomyces violens TaxID=66377 RepID=UPI0004C17260|nr:type I-E CRISPR-associated protein Cse2/CasB [Streptomyces violens]